MKMVLKMIFEKECRSLIKVLLAKENVKNKYPDEKRCERWSWNI